MNQPCFICDSRSGNTLRNTTDIFTEYTVKKQSFASLISEIIDKPVQLDNAHSSILCRKCYKTCLEYDNTKLRLQCLKTEIIDQLKTTLPKHNLNYDTYNVEQSNSPAKEGNTEKKAMGKIVLPASKLQPVPSDYFIDLSNLNKAKNPVILLRSKKTSSTSPSKEVSTTQSPVKPTIKTNILPSKTTLVKSNNSFNTSSPGKSLKSRSDSIITLDPKTSEQILNLDPKTTESILNLDPKTTDQILNLDPKTTESILAMDYKATNSVMNSNRKTNSVLSFDGDGFINITEEKSTEDIKMEVLENNVEEEMEIDEECMLVRINESDPLNNETSEKSESDDKGSYFDMSLLQTSSVDAGQTVLGKLRVIGEDDEDEDDDEQTILMTGENGIMRVVSGHKLLLEDGEISLVMPDDDDDDDDGNQGDDTNDGHDSNDESQIELQVSGDEETANAIIAAAAEQGGAFIKVESGEMFRVKSIQSKNAETQISDAFQMVEKKGGTFRCLLCDKSESTKPDKISNFGNAQSIMLHLKTAHDARIYICQVCNKIMRKRTDYTAHMDEHAAKNNALLADKTKIHECNVCKKRFSSRALLSEHMNIHTGTRPYVCSVCSKAFTSKYTHHAHLKTHLERPRPFNCRQCSKSFLTQQNLTQHERTHSGVKDFVCTICGKAFGTQHNLEVHGVVHSGSKPFVCSVCGKGFARRAEVKDHMRIHTGERPFACDVCGATFSQRSNLHSHKRATHLNDKRYACKECPKKFKRRRLLDYHMAVHTGERPLQCEYCHATFVYPEHYKKHVRIHSGEKPYECEICGKQFNSRDNRNTHRFVHSDKKPYECLVCGAGYMRKQLLYAHMNTSGHLAESIVVNQPRVKEYSTQLELKDESTGHATESIMVNQTQAKEYGSQLFKYPIVDLEMVSTERKTDDIAQEGDGDTTLLTLHNIEGDGKTNATILQGISTDQFEQTQMVASDENGAVVRLVQIQLQNGNSGWVAINE